MVIIGIALVVADEVDVAGVGTEEVEVVAVVAIATAMEEAFASSATNLVISPASVLKLVVVAMAETFVSNAINLDTFPGNVLKEVAVEILLATDANSLGIYPVIVPREEVVVASSATKKVIWLGTVPPVETVVVVGDEVVLVVGEVDVGVAVVLAVVVVEAVLIGIVVVSVLMPLHKTRKSHLIN